MKDKIEKITQVIFPNIFGYSKIKESLIIQFLSKKPFNILLIGDPGSGKSQFIESISNFENIEIPKEKEITKIIKSQNYILLDGFDKMSDNECLKYFNEEKSILATANPKLGRFDPYADIVKQISFSPSVLSRFDLIFIMRDIPDKKRDGLIAEKSFNNYVNDNNLPSIDEELKKNLNDLKNINVKLSNEVLEKIKKFYVDIRNATYDDEFKGVLITARQLNSILVITENYTKLQDKDLGEANEVQSAIDLYSYCLEKIGIDPKKGELDIDRITSGITTSDRSEYKQVTEIIEEFRDSQPEILIEDVLLRAEDFSLNPKLVSSIIEKLKHEGIIFEPRRGILKFLL